MKQEELDQLLTHLDADREQAGAKYNLLRRKLINYFRLIGHSSPDDAADITLDRVAAKLAAEVPVRDVSDFSFGVARLIGKEGQRKQIQTQKAMYDMAFLQSATEAIDERVFKLMQRCLDNLLPEDQAFLISYHTGTDMAELARKRQAMATEMQTSLNTLRLRVYRLRLKLETCLRASRQE